LHECDVNYQRKTQLSSAHTVCAVLTVCLSKYSHSPSLIYKSTESYFLRVLPDAVAFYNSHYISMTFQPPLIESLNAGYLHIYTLIVKPLASTNHFKSDCQLTIVSVSCSQQ
jgi:hypothetical protein